MSRDCELPLALWTKSVSAGRQRSLPTTRQEKHEYGRDYRSDATGQQQPRHHAWATTTAALCRPAGADADDRFHDPRAKQEQRDQERTDRSRGLHEQEILVNRYALSARWRPARYRFGREAAVVCSSRGSSSGKASGVLACDGRKPVRVSACEDPAGWRMSLERVVRSGTPGRGGPRVDGGVRECPVGAHQRFLRPPVLELERREPQPAGAIREPDQAPALD